MNQDFFEKLIIGLASAIISGAIAVFISTWIYKKNELRKAKLDVFRKLMGFRYDIYSKEFAEALNSIFVIFYKSDEVIVALKNFHDATISTHKETSKVEAKLLELFKAISNDLGINVGAFSDNFFLMPFQSKRSVN
ncbi:hypothetical protein J1TS5_03230 [Paenibacillus macerans]|uniref:DUF6680 family protein n=1 Tax=Paenibacillus macerans TaxID=44252 RepID=UPI001B106592|nr:DUF6680 family protein [Paenibacillus macerans]GIP08153.1 hypothetical protein J1TS5_03230 [Paenibacillus macerans]